MDDPSSSICPGDAPSSSSSGGSMLRDLLLISSSVLLTCLALALHNVRLHRRSERAECAAQARAKKRKERVLMSIPMAKKCADLVMDGKLEGDAAGGEFFSSVIRQLWHHLNVAVSDCIKDTMEPMLKGLKVPLHFVELDLGDVPIRTENIFIHRVEMDQNNDFGFEGESHRERETMTSQTHSGIQIDLDVVWDGNCDVCLQASLIGNIAKSIEQSVGGPKVTFGVKRVKLSGRMHILLSPLTTVLPVVSAIQYGFTNPPDIELEFAGVAKSIAKQFAFVQPAVLGIVKRSLANKVVLPMRMICPLDLVGYDYLETYQPPVGMIRISVIKGWGFSILKKMLIADIPDIYCLISLGGSNPPFRTSTRWDDCSPSWKDESHDFVLYDMDQKIYIEAYDDDPSPSMVPVMGAGFPLGKAEITVRDLFRRRRSSVDNESNDATVDLELAADCKPRTGHFIQISGEMFSLSDRLHSLSSLQYEGEHRMCGLVTVIITRAFDLPLSTEEAASYVKVEYGRKTKNRFLTGTVWHDQNPMYNGAFHIPLTADMIKQDTIGDEAAAPASDFDHPSPCQENESLPDSGKHTKSNKSKLMKSITKTSMYVVEHAVNWQTQPSCKKRNKNDIVFTLMNCDSPNVSSHKELGSFTVTHESLIRAHNHTITERRPIGEDGASLEVRVVLSGMQSEEEKLQSEGDSSSHVVPESVMSPVNNEKRSIRVTAVKGRGFLLGKKNLVLGKKNVIPDVYCIIRLNSSQKRPQSHPSFSWRTSTIRDDTMPKWEEEKTFVTEDFSLDLIRVDAYDEHRTSKDKYLGSAEYPLEKLLRKRLMELELRNGTELTGSFVTIKCVQRAVGDIRENESEDDGRIVNGDNDGPSVLMPQRPPSALRPSRYTAEIIPESDSDSDDEFFARAYTEPNFKRVNKMAASRRAMMRSITMPPDMKDKITSQIQKGRHTIDTIRHKEKK